MEEDKKPGEEARAADDVKGSDGAASGQKRRSVVIGRKARVVFESRSGGEKSVEEVDRDLFSVIDCIGRRLQLIKDRGGMDDVLVSVHSVEDPAKSDPLPEGERPWEGEYLVGGVKIEKASIPEAMKSLSSAVIPNDMAVNGVERLAEQLFLRSRLDGFVFVASFDGQPAVVPLISSFKPQTPMCFAALYRTMSDCARNFRAWAEREFPDVAKDTDWGDRPPAGPKQPMSGLVLPSGAPVETRMKTKGGLAK